MNERMINRYLSELESYLVSLSVGERADIITEIKTHLVESSSSESYEEFVRKFGSPKEIALRYVDKLPKSYQPSGFGQAFKWFSISALGIVSIFALLIGLFVWKLTPLIEISESTGQVKVLGGLINVAADRFEFGQMRGKKVDGKIQIDPKISKSIVINFSNGKMDFNNSKSQEMRYDCRLVTKENLGPKISQKNEIISLDFSGVKGSRCKVLVPIGLNIEVSGTNGKINLEEIQNSTKINLVNGRLGIVENEKVNFLYDLNVGNGFVDSFESNASNYQYKIEAKIGNGSIKKL